MFRNFIKLLNNLIVFMIIYNLLFNFIFCDLTTNMYKLTNLYRKMHNLKELKENEALRLASELQANTICKEMKLTHNNPLDNKSTLRDRLNFFNFRGINIGENIAKQQNTDFKEVFKVWIKSELHRKNILGDYTFTNVATCKGRDGNRYWVQVFGKGYIDWEGSKYNLQNYIKDNVIQDGLSNLSLDTPMLSDTTDNNQCTGDCLTQKLLPYESPNTKILNLVPTNRKDKPNRNSNKSVLAQKIKFKNLNSSTQSTVTAQNSIEDIVFLIKDSENVDSSITDRIPSTFSLIYKGKYKKYVAVKTQKRDKKSSTRGFNTTSSTQKSVSNKKTLTSMQQSSAVTSTAKATAYKNSTSLRGTKDSTTSLVNTTNGSKASTLSSENSIINQIDINKIIEEIVNKLKTINKSKDKDFDINSQTSVPVRPQNSTTQTSATIKLSTQTTTSVNTSNSVRTTSKHTQISSTQSSTSSLFTTQSSSSIIPNDSSITCSQPTISNTITTSTSSQSIPTCVTTVLKTIYRYETINKEHEKTSTHKTISLTYTKPNKEKSTEDKNITVTVSLDSDKEKSPDEVNNNLKRIMLGVLNKYKNKESDEDNKLCEYVDSFCTQKQSASEIDIGEPLYFST